MKNVLFYVSFAALTVALFLAAASVLTDNLYFAFGCVIAITVTCFTRAMWSRLFDKKKGPRHEAQPAQKPTSLLGRFEMYAERGFMLAGVCFMALLVANSNKVVVQSILQAGEGFKINFLGVALLIASIVIPAVMGDFVARKLKKRLCL